MSGARYVSRSSGAVGASYSVVVPPGFVRIPGGASPAAALAFVQDQLGDVDVDAGHGFETRFVDALRRVGEADEHHAVLDSFVTCGAVPDVGVACSIVFAAVPTVPGPHSDLDRLLLARIAAGATGVDVGGDPAVTWELDRPAPAGPGPEHALRRRAVLARVVGHDHLLVSIVLTVVADTGGDTPARREVADAFVELFEAVLTTVRWRDEAGRLITDRPTA
ncbi:hypothetical protein [Frigoribacterium sp. PvP032]|uniref:hypothetical protein n=1 Tax=Frigoribacterium sp. PvP032 TaxID=2806589 RepID=UPI001AE4CCDC|nr:hypothetical protein [Frigoribacterium sp. PvP032]MBP1191858.1 hypothetical protein [Frigoribacterium sp. PvP032]